MSAPTELEFLAFIHGMLNGHSAALAGLTVRQICDLSSEIESELNLPPAEVGQHPCFVAIQNTKAWRSRMERAQ